MEPFCGFYHGSVLKTDKSGPHPEENIDAHFDNISWKLGTTVRNPKFFFTKNGYQFVGKFFRLCAAILERNIWRVQRTIRRRTERPNRTAWKSSRGCVTMFLNITSIRTHVSSHSHTCITTSYISQQTSNLSRSYCPEFLQIQRLQAFRWLCWHTANLKFLQ